MHSLGQLRKERRQLWHVEIVYGHSHDSNLIFIFGRHHHQGTVNNFIVHLVQRPHQTQFSWRLAAMLGGMKRQAWRRGGGYFQNEARALALAREPYVLLGLALQLSGEEAAAAAAEAVRGCQAMYLASYVVGKLVKVWPNFEIKHGMRTPLHCCSWHLFRTDEETGHNYDAMKRLPLLNDRDQLHLSRIIIAVPLLVV